jgi:hypothetical protein
MYAPFILDCMSLLVIASIILNVMRYQENDFLSAG